MLIDRNELIGKTLGTCILEQQIGQGGMGSVYLARQIRPRRQVAVKVLLPGLALDEKARADFLARFRREADAIAALDHIHIIPVYEYGEKDQQAYLVMPYITGGTLRHVLQVRGSLPLKETLPVLEQIAHALDYAHGQGIIHRDIKPGNILFHADGRLLLTDFGLAKILSETSELPVVMDVPLPEQREQVSLSQGALIGTPEYLSPEQALGREVDRRTDIYSLGILLFQMLTGRVPFLGTTPIATAIMHAQSDPPSPSALMPTIPPAVEEVILRAIAKQPEERYATAGELLSAFLAACAASEAGHSGNASLSASTQTTRMLLSNDTQPELDQVQMAGDVTEQATPVAPEAALISEPAKLVPLASQQRSSRKRSLVLMLCVVLALVLVGGGLAVSLARLHALTVAPGSTTHLHLTATPTLVLQPTPTPASTEPAFAQPLIKTGPLLYASKILNSTCPGGTGSWALNTIALITCGNAATELANSMHSKNYLASMYFNSFSDGEGIPDDYILQVQFRQAPGSQGQFGVLFRNQPGQNNGAYSFLIDPTNTTWSALAYNSVTGASTTLTTQPLTVVLAGTMTFDLVVQGSLFTFYLNGQFQGTARDSTYTSGTVGFSVDPNAAIYFSNLAIYQLPTH
jgi:serine/threonine protein kinase